MVVGVGAVYLIHQRAHALLEIAAERRFPTDAQHLAARTHAVIEQSLVAAPRAEHQFVVGHAVQERIVDIPGVLPLGRLVTQIEVAPESGEIDADGERSLTEQIAAAVQVVLAGILGVQGKRYFSGIDEASHVGRFLIALRLRYAAGSEEIPKQRARRVGQPAAAVLELTIDAERPPAEGFYGELRAEQFRVAAPLDSSALPAA